MSFEILFLFLFLFLWLKKKQKSDVLYGLLVEKYCCKIVPQSCQNKNVCYMKKSTENGYKQN